MAPKGAGWIGNGVLMELFVLLLRVIASLVHPRNDGRVFVKLLKSNTDQGGEM